MNKYIEELKRVQKDMSPFALTIYEIITEWKPEVVFEIGVCRGCSTKAVLSALEDNQKGILYSIDLKDRTKSIPDNLAKKWRFYQADSRKFYKNWDKPIDLLIIDGSHRYDVAKSDFENYSKFVKEGGYILFHDTVSLEGSKRYFKEIKYPKVNFPWVDGMGIIQKYGQGKF